MGGARIGLRLQLFLSLAAVCLATGQVTEEQRLDTLLLSLQGDGLIVPSQDMGVARHAWTFSVDNPLFPHKPARLGVNLTMFLRYTTWAGIAYLKGFVVADTRDVAQLVETIALEPRFQLTSNNSQDVHSWMVKCEVHSYWSPPGQAAMVYSFEHNFTVPVNSKHEYDLVMNLQPKPQRFYPALQLNQLDGRALEVPPVVPRLNASREVFVVLKPFSSFIAHIHGALLERHVSYYQTLGVSKHIIYLRRHHVPQLLTSSSELHKLIVAGKVILLLWEQTPLHQTLLSQYDQRVVYSHAMLAFKGMDVYLVNIDIDEYLVSARADIQMLPIQAMIETCAGATPEARITRYHSICKACDHAQPEAHIWTNYFNIHHPISWYHLANLMELPKKRTVSNPNYVQTHYISYSNLNPGHNSTHVPANCLSLLHIVNQVRVRHDARLIQQQYVEDHSWMGLLQRYRASSLQSAQQAKAEMMAMIERQQAEEAEYLRIQAAQKAANRGLQAKPGVQMSKKATGRQLLGLELTANGTSHRQAAVHSSMQRRRLQQQALRVQCWEPEADSPVWVPSVQGISGAAC